jgi:hypothetical protein
MSFNDDDAIKTYYYGFNEKPMEIRKKCETSYYLKKKDLASFDTGVYGSVSEVCQKSDCKYIVKAIPLQHANVYKTFLREALIAPLMAKHNVGPKIFDIFICLNIGYIIMEKWEGTIKHIHENITDNHLTTISDLIVKMHKYGVIHNDLHTANILYRTTKNNKYEFSITDYGLSLYFENKNEIIPPKFLPNNKSPNIFFPAFDFYRLNNALESRQNMVFITFFFNKGYITLIDYILADKYFLRKMNIDIGFYDYIKNINLDEKKIIKSTSGLKNSIFKHNKQLLFNKTISIEGVKNVKSKKKVNSKKNVNSEQNVNSKKNVNSEQNVNSKKNVNSEQNVNSNNKIKNKASYNTTILDKINNQ